MADIWNLNALCRCCHKDGYFRSMQYPYVGKHGDVQVYNSWMKEVFGIVMVTPSVAASEMICEECITSLRDARTFKKQVTDCELRFQQYCRNETIVKIEPDENAHSESKIKIIQDFDFINSYPSKKDEDRKIKIESDNENDKSDNIDDCDNIDSCDNMDICDNDDSNSGSEVSEPLPKNDNDKKGKKKVSNVKTVKRKVANNINGLDSDSETLTKKIVETKGKKKVSNVKSKVTKTVKRKYTKRMVNKGGPKRLPEVKCQFCNEMVKGGVPKYKRHIKSIHPGKGTVCRFCPEIFLYRAHLKKHYAKFHKSSEKYTCDICQKKFYSKTVMRHHIQRIHLDGKKYTCHMCAHRFCIESNLKSHILEVHENLRPYQCEFCPKNYKTKRNLNTHTRSIHTFERPFACDICGKRFVTQNDLTKHTRIHPDGKNENYNTIIKEDGTTEDIPNPTRFYRCFMCNETQPGRRAYTKHIEEKHSGMLPHQCHMCTKSFSTRYILNRHILSHDETSTNRVQCGRCLKHFKHNLTLLAHMKRTHYVDDNNLRVTKKGYVRCDICRNLIKAIDLEKHKAVHLKRPFKCTQCEKDYSCHSTLKRHIKEVHMKLFNHSCDICDKTFIKKSTMGKHRKKRHPQMFQNEMKMEADT